MYINGNKDVRNTSALSTSNWTHVAVTYNGSALKFYVNGTEIASNAMTGSIGTSTNPLYIGGNSIWGEYFNGLIDEVRIYNVALTPAEIQNDMNTAVASPPSITPTITGTPSATPTPTSSPTGAQIGQWSSIMNWPLVAVHAVLMNTGKVLMWDGWEIPAYARVWDPSNNSFISVTNQSGLFCSGHSTLADGRIVVAGGHNENGDGIRDTNIFNPATNSWTAAPNMSQARWYPSVTTLNDNKVVTISGSSDAVDWADIPEIYNPTTNTWSNLTGVNTSDMRDIMYPHPYMLDNGTLYVIAPSTGVVRRLNVSNKTWTTMADAPFLNSATVMYRPGKFMIAGGGPEFSNSQKNTAVIDLNTANPSWRSTSAMAYPRFQHNLVMLPDGKVLAVGGSKEVDKGSTNGTLQAELWDPATETWQTMASMADPRMYHSIAMLMPDGRVLSAGGGRYGSTNNYLTAQYYSPPYLFKGARPTISSMPSTAGYNTSITVQTADASSISKVTFIPLASVTHTMDMNQRYIELTFTKNSGNLSVTTPANTSQAPAGYYMLFIVNSNGVPSVAKIIQLSASQPTGSPTPTQNPTPTSTIAPTPTNVPSPTPTTGAGTQVAAFSFNENSGTTVADNSGKGNNGTINGATWTTGKYGSALSFNGTSNYVTVNDSNTLDLTNAMTLEAWIKPTTLNGWNSILLKEQADNLSYAMYANTDGNVPSGEIFSTYNDYVRSPSPVSVNNWTHIASTYNGTTLKIYINGTEVASKNTNGLIKTSNNALRIGGNSIWGEYFNGVIDEIRIYNKVLSATEIQSDMNTAIGSSPTVTPSITVTPTQIPTPTPTVSSAPTPTPTNTPASPPVAAFSFNENTGSTLNDSSGNGNNGTINGATWTTGKFGNALTFNGSSNYVTINDSNSLDLTNAMTLEAWVKPAAFTEWNTILLKEQSGNLVYGMYANTDGNVPSGESFTTYGDYVRSPAQLPLNSWSHIAVTYNSSVLKIFINGVEVGSKSINGALKTSTNPLRIGGNTVWGEYFNGQIDEIRIYNRALNASEIQQDMNKGI